FAAPKRLSLNRHVFFNSPECGTQLAAVTPEGSQHIHFGSPDLERGPDVDLDMGEMDKENVEKENGTEYKSPAQAQAPFLPPSLSKAVGAVKWAAAGAWSGATQGGGQGKGEIKKGEIRKDVLKDTGRGHNDTVMSFWLSKAFAQPSKSFFN
ncbi:hypothetical protein B484DRAFT_390012, partial [Ochromonadaceae sp. CCMP2298]